MITGKIVMANKEVIPFELYEEDAPITVANFVKLIKEGYYNGKTTFTEDQLAAADVNGDGVVNHFDAAMIYGFYNGKITKFPAEA